MFQTLYNFAVKERSDIGKTVMVLLLSALRKKGGNRVLVVLVNEFLYQQFSLKNTIYFADDPVDFELPENLIPDRCKDFKVILDETQYELARFAA